MATPTTTAATLKAISHFLARMTTNLRYEHTHTRDDDISSPAVNDVSYVSFLKSLVFLNPS